MGFYADKILPALTDAMTAPMEGARAKLMSSLSGDVLEIGFGSGLSLAHYPETVSSVTGVEPGRGMLDRVGKRRGDPTQGPNLRISKGMAEAMPFADESFDAALSFLTLCTVGDLQRSIEEIQRVLKPGGRLHFFEHVLHPEKKLLRAFQRGLNPLWKTIGGGCCLDRDTEGALAQRGFRFDWIERLDSPSGPKVVSRIIRGVAEAP